MRQIDAQLQALQPNWGRKDYDGERKMLYDMMGDDEHIERLSAGNWKVLQRVLGCYTVGSTSWVLVS